MSNAKGYIVRLFSRGGELVRTDGLFYTHKAAHQHAAAMLTYFGLSPVVMTHIGAGMFYPEQRGIQPIRRGHLVTLHQDGQERVFGPYSFDAAIVIARYVRGQFPMPLEQRFRSFSINIRNIEDLPGKVRCTACHCTTTDLRPMHDCWRVRPDGACPGTLAADPRQWAK